MEKKTNQGVAGGKRMKKTPPSFFYSLIIKDDIDDQKRRTDSVQQDEASTSETKKVKENLTKQNWKQDSENVNRKRPLFSCGVVCLNAFKKLFNSNLPIGVVYAKDKGFLACIKKKPCSECCEDKAPPVKETKPETLDPISEYICQFKNCLACVKKEIGSGIAYLKEDEHRLERYGAITAGGLLGLLAATGRGRLRKVIYTSLGAGSVYAIIYPTRTCCYIECTGEKIRRFTIMTYKFLTDENFDPLIDGDDVAVTSKESKPKKVDKNCPVHGEKKKKQPPPKKEPVKPKKDPPPPCPPASPPPQPKPCDEPIKQPNYEPIRPEPPACDEPIKLPHCEPIRPEPKTCSYEPFQPSEQPPSS